MKSFPCHGKIWKTHTFCQISYECECICHFSREKPFFEPYQKNLFIKNKENPFKVYRLENSLGEGPFKKNWLEYQGILTLEDIMDLNTLNFLHPTEDFSLEELFEIGFVNPKYLSSPTKLMVKKKVLFGCLYKEQFDFWFTKPTLEKLKTYGFNIVEKWTNFALISEYQCIFRKIL